MVLNITLLGVIVVLGFFLLNPLFFRGFWGKHKWDIVLINSSGSDLYLYGGDAYYQKAQEAEMGSPCYFHNRTYITEGEVVWLGSSERSLPNVFHLEWLSFANGQCYRFRGSYSYARLRAEMKLLPRDASLYLRVLPTFEVELSVGARLAWEEDPHFEDEDPEYYTYTGGIERLDRKVLAVFSPKKISAEQVSFFKDSDDEQVEAYVANKLAHPEAFAGRYRWRLGSWVKESSLDHFSIYFHTYPQHSFDNYDFEKQATDSIFSALPDEIYLEWSYEQTGSYSGNSRKLTFDFGQMLRGLRAIDSLSGGGVPALELDLKRKPSDTIQAHFRVGKVKVPLEVQVSD